MPDKINGVGDRDDADAKVPRRARDNSTDLRNATEGSTQQTRGRIPEKGAINDLAQASPVLSPSGSVVAGPELTHRLAAFSMRRKRDQSRGQCFEIS